MRLPYVVVLGLWMGCTLGAQDPYRVAGDHYHLLFSERVGTRHASHLWAA
jgi:hypothetical protein